SRMLSGVLSVCVFGIGCARNEVVSLHPPSSPLQLARAGLYPETLAYDPAGSRFLVGSFREGAIYEVHADGHVTSVVDDPRLCSVLGIAVDDRRGRLWAVNSDLGACVRASPVGPKNLAAVGVYDLRSGAPLQYVDLTQALPSLPTGPHLLNGLALDGAGNAYVSDSFSPAIYRIDAAGNPELFLQTPEFAGEGVNLNGLVVHPAGYLLVIKKSDGALFKVPLQDPERYARVSLSEPLFGGDGLVLVDDRNLVVVSNQTPQHASNSALVLRSTDDWARASVVARQALGDVYPTTAALRGADLYVIHSKLNELIQAPPDQKSKYNAFATIQQIGHVQHAAW
ncbi:MAG TPA: hypothetical protein VFQ61_10105, partial [Polyangiaceae bacterium]|nr:hypothetical protein [Polyangiaceae bacterium]